MKKQILLASVLGALALPVMADGFYLLGDVGQGKLEADLGDDTVYKKNSTAYSIGAGYEANKFFAVEVAYRDLGGISSSDSYTVGNTTYSESNNVDYTVFQASVIGKLPVSDVVNVYGRLGVGKISFDWTDTVRGGSYYDQESDSESKTKALVGIGASYNITPKIALRAEYNQFAKWDDIKLSSLTVGATYAF